jgi:hypothetical protein
VRLTALEGGAGDYDLSPFTDIKDLELRGKVADYFVRQGEVNGAELYAINNPSKVTLYGIEDPALYEENLAAYMESLKFKEKALATLNKMAEDISKRKDKIYPSDFRQLDKKLSLFRNDKITFEEYAAAVDAYAKEKNMDMSGYPNIGRFYDVVEREKDVNMKEAERERNIVIDLLNKRLSKKYLEELVTKTVEFNDGNMPPEEYYAYLMSKARLCGLDLDKMPNLLKYTETAKQTKGVDKKVLEKEFKALEEVIRSSFLKTDEEKALASLDKNVFILNRLFSVGLVKDDWDYYVSRRKDFETKEFASLKNYRIEMEKFYALSLKRDDVFMINIADELKKEGQNNIILVTGGFHQDNLKKLFQDKGYSYIEVLPRIDKEEGVNPYFKLLSGGMDPITKAVLESRSTLQIASYLSDKLGLDKNKEAFRMAVAIVAKILSTDQPIYAKVNGKTIEFDLDTGAKEFTGDTEGLQIEDIKAFIPVAQPQAPAAPTGGVRYPTRDTPDGGKLYYGYYNPDGNRLVVDTDKVRDAFGKNIVGLEVAGFIHAHEVFHLLVRNAKISLSTADEEEKLADIFAMQAVGVRHTELGQSLLVEFGKKISDKDIRDKFELFCNTTEKDYLLNLHRLGIDIYNIEIEKIASLPKGAKGMGLEQPPNAELLAASQAYAEAVLTQARALVQEHPDQAVHILTKFVEQKVVPYDKVKVIMSEAIIKCSKSDMHLDDMHHDLVCDTMLMLLDQGLITYANPDDKRFINIIIMRWQSKKNQTELVTKIIRRLISKGQLDYNRSEGILYSIISDGFRIKSPDVVGIIIELIKKGNLGYLPAAYFIKKCNDDLRRPDLAASMALAYAKLSDSTYYQMEEIIKTWFADRPDLAVGILATFLQFSKEKLTEDVKKVIKSEIEKLYAISSDSDGKYMKGHPEYAAIIRINQIKLKEKQFTEVKAEIEGAIRRCINLAHIQSMPGDYNPAVGYILGNLIELIRPDEITKIARITYVDYTSMTKPLESHNTPDMEYCDIDQAAGIVMELIDLGALQYHDGDLDGENIINAVIARCDSADKPALAGAIIKKLIELGKISYENKHDKNIIDKYVLKKAPPEEIAKTYIKLMRSELMRSEKVKDKKEEVEKDKEEKYKTFKRDMENAIDAFFEQQRPDLAVDIIMELLGGGYITYEQNKDLLLDALHTCELLKRYDLSAKIFIKILKLNNEQKIILSPEGIDEVKQLLDDDLKAYKEASQAENGQSLEPGSLNLAGGLQPAAVVTAVITAENAKAILPLINALFAREMTKKGFKPNQFVSENIATKDDFADWLRLCNELSWPRSSLTDDDIKKLNRIANEMSTKIGIKDVVDTALQMSAATSQSPAAGLMGKYDVIGEAVYDKQEGVVTMTVKNIETGKTDTISLKARRMTTDEISSSLANIELMRASTNNAVAHGILDWFIAPCKTGVVIVIEDNKYGIHGIGQAGLIAVTESALKNPIALFHEAGEAAIKEAEAAKTKEFTAKDVLASLRVPENVAWYYQRITKPGRLSMEVHYALRALQRELYPELDKALTAGIKGAPAAAPAPVQAPPATATQVAPVPAAEPVAKTALLAYDEDLAALNKLYQEKDVTTGTEAIREWGRKFAAYAKQFFDKYGLLAAAKDLSAKLGIGMKEANDLIREVETALNAPEFAELVALSDVRNYVDVVLKDGRTIRGTLTYFGPDEYDEIIVEFILDSYNDRGTLESVVVSPDEVVSIKKVSAEEINRRLPIKSKYLYGHGTNAYTLLMAARFTNSQLWPSDEVPGTIFVGENLGATALNKQWVSTVALNSVQGDLFDVLRYANGATRSAVTLDNVESRIVKARKILGTIGKDYEDYQKRYIVALERAKAELLRMKQSPGLYEEYLKFSSMPVCLVGDGLIQGEVFSDISAETVFKRLNIRVVGVVGKENVELIRNMLLREGVTDILVLEQEELDRLVEEHKNIVSDFRSREESPLVKTINATVSATDQAAAPASVQAPPAVTPGVKGAPGIIVTSYKEIADDMPNKAKGVMEILSSLFKREGYRVIVSGAEPTDDKGESDASVLSLPGKLTGERNEGNRYINERLNMGIYLAHTTGTEAAKREIRKIANENPKQELVSYTMSAYLLSQLENDIEFKKDLGLAKDKTIESLLREKTIFDVVVDFKENESKEKVVYLMPYFQATAVGLSRLNVIDMIPGIKGRIGQDADVTKDGEFIKAYEAFCRAVSLLSGQDYSEEFAAMMKKVDDKGNRIDPLLFFKTYDIPLLIPQITPIDFSEMQRVIDGMKEAWRSL